jgi:hypothetical protein
MIRPIQPAATAAALALTLAVAACAESTTEPDALSALDLTAAFNSLPQGYDQATISYAGSAPATGLWVANARGDRLGGGLLMGGGLRDALLGGVAFGPGGRGGHRGPFGGGIGCGNGTAGTFNAASGRVECPAETRGGVTVTRSAAYANAAGQTQQAFDTLTTNTVTVRVAASGTVTFDSASGRGRGGFGFGHHGGRGPKGGRGGRGLLLGDTATILSATTTVRSTSERITGGLAQGSTQRTVTGTSSASESTTGTSSRGAFTTVRTAADTTRGIVIPVATAANAVPYPTAGTIVRVMSATVTFAGQTPLTAARREVVTYDGTATARVVITTNGTTRTCTRPLPRGPLSCS